MQGFLFRDGMSAADLLEAGRAEVTGYGVELIEDRVVTIEAGFLVRTAGDRTLDARRILMATGVSDELPNIPGVLERWGRDLLHCPYCHGWEIRDQPLGVLGTQSGSVQHAQLVGSGRRTSSSSPTPSSRPPPRKHSWTRARSGSFVERSAVSSLMLTG
jgi:thioredoxin reductase